MRSLWAGEFDSLEMGYGEGCFPLSWRFTLSKRGVIDKAEWGSKFVSRFLVNFNLEGDRCIGTSLDLKLRSFSRL